MSFAADYRLNQPYRVETVRASDGHSTDITAHVVAIEKAVDTAGGDIPTATITLNTRDGVFITTHINTTSSLASPAPDQFDLVRIIMYDDTADPSDRTMNPNRQGLFERIFYVDEAEPQQAIQGQTCDYHLFGREAHLKHVKFTGHYYFVSAVSVIVDILNFYNAARGTNQPEIVFSTSGAAPTIVVPDYPAGIFDFGKETNCYDAIQQVLAFLSLPVAGGGAADYFDMRFEETSVNIDQHKKILCRIFSMGSRTTAPYARGSSVPAGVVIEGKSAYTQHVTETREPIQANLVVVEGAADAGTLPSRVAEFSHAIDLYNNFPIHSSSISYPRGVYVRDSLFVNEVTAVGSVAYNPDNHVYRAGGTRNAAVVPRGTRLTDASYWTPISIADYVNLGLPAEATRERQSYSPWTRNLANAYIASCSGGATANPSFVPANAKPNPGHVAVPDGNMVVKDGTHYRTWANVRANSLEGIPAVYKYDNPATRAVDKTLVPEDFRVLVDGSLPLPRSETPFYRAAGRVWKSDPFGRSYHNSIVQLRDGQWIVIRRAQDEMECAVRHEGIVYLYTRGFDGWYRRPRVYGDDETCDSDARTGKGCAVKFSTSGAYAWVPLMTANGSNTEPNPDSTDGRGMRGIDRQGNPVPSEFDLWFGNDCFHYPSRIENQPGLVYPYRRGSTPQGQALYFRDQSSVYWEYRWGQAPSDIAQRNPFSILNLLGSLLEPLWTTLTSRLYCQGSWAILFEAPFPASSSTESPGFLFGGDDPKRSVLDFNNLNHTPSGQRGWGAPDAEELGPITGISFWMRFVIGLNPPLVPHSQVDRTSSSQTLVPNPNFVPVPAGDLSWSVFIYDTEDNVWRASFTYRFPGDTEQVVIPLSAFKIYRARNPVALSADDYIQNVLTPELKILEIFERRKVKMITLQWDESYDADGRFDPVSAERLLWRLAGGAVTGGDAHTGLWTDTFAFVRAPVVRHPRTHLDGTMHYADNIVPYPSVYNMRQLRSIAHAEYDRAQFRKDVFVVRTAGRCDLRAGDYCYLHDEDVIPENSHDRPALASSGRQLTRLPTDPTGLILYNGLVWHKNTKKLVVRAVVHMVNSQDGPGGYVAEITLADRIGF